MYENSHSNSRNYQKTRLLPKGLAVELRSPLFAVDCPDSLTLRCCQCLPCSLQGPETGWTQTGFGLRPASALGYHGTSAEERSDPLRVFKR